MTAHERAGRRQEDLALQPEKAHQAWVVGDAGPVSYTHLRAHETVLDLVCRLLLEKKTKNTTDADTAV